jgi:hypothetical protein
VDWKEFAYSSYIHDFETGELIWQPTLKVKLLPKEGFLSFPTEMIVDSGATDCLIDARVGEAIGIDVKNGQTRLIGGIVGRTEVFVHRVQILLLNLHDTLDIEVGFVYDMGASGLLGQIDFFSRYYVNFDGRKRTFRLKQIPALDF